jgi:hypothetical protein
MEMFQGNARPAGAVGLARSVDLGDLAMRRASLGWRLRNFLTHRRKTVGQVAAAKFAGRVFGFAPVTAALSGVHYRPDWSRLAPEVALKLKVLLQARVDLTAQQIDELLGRLGGYVDIRDLPRYFGGELTDYGVLSRRLVTNAGVNYLVDALQNLQEPENLKFHGFGTGTNAENVTDTALQTELTTQYAVDNTRPTGSLTEGASANIFRTVATLSPDSGGTIAITEHGVFSASSSVTLLDRSVFSAVNLVAGSDSLQATYDLTVAAGG